MSSALVGIVAYLLGSVSFAVLTSRLFGLPDPRSYGSGNPGATNVLRSGKKAAALLTLLGDAAKGVVPVVLARVAAPTFGWGDWTVALVALAVFIGHLYPIYFGFKGGKGVATATGVLLGLNPGLAGVVLLVFLVVVLATRYVSLASILAALAAVVLAPWLEGWTPAALSISVMAGFIVWRHRANIQRLLSGQERKVRRGRARGI